MKFPGVEALVAQIRQDIATARRLLSADPARPAGDGHQRQN
jgi:hypothetical protein